jgi:CheY-like chemotaxis protein
MAHIGTTMLIEARQEVPPLLQRTAPPRLSILVPRDGGKNHEVIDEICEFLNVSVEYAGSENDLYTLLSGLRPMAVIAELDGAGQDGFHVMKVAARYDRQLPILLLSCNDSTLLGAVDAVREIFGLTSVATVSDESCTGEIADFICRAAREAGMSRLMRI